MVFIHLEQHDLNKARVAQRVLAGGHNVADEKVETRIVRTLGHVKTAMPLCDRIEVFDNSSTDKPFKRVMGIASGVKTLHVQPLPEWAARLQGTVNVKE